MTRRTISTSRRLNGEVSSVSGDGTEGTTSTFGYNGAGTMSTVSTAATSGDIVTTYHYNASNGHLESIVTMQGRRTASNAVMMTRPAETDR